MFNLKKIFKSGAYRYLNIYPYRDYMYKNKCIFIHIPKNAGTSVLQVLNGNSRKVQRDHSTIQNFISADRNLFNNFYKFAFSRHPVDRCLSTYNYLKAGGNKTTDLPFVKKIGFSSMTFEDFVLDFLDSDRINSELILKPQYSFVCTGDYNLSVDFVGKVENFEDDFKVVCNRLGVNFSAPVINKSSSAEQDYKFDHKVLHKIQDLYARDFFIFDYDLSKKI